jgi:hypothetical protein
LASDYTVTATGGLISIDRLSIMLDPGVTSATITVTPVDDTLVDAAETVTLTLTSGTGYSVGTPASANGTIADNDAPLPTLSISDASVVEGHGGTRNVTITVTLSAASTSTVTVSYATGAGTATAGVDYTTASGTLTFTPGQTSKTITLQVSGDRTVEPNETFNVVLSAPSGATIADDTGVVTIVTDDTAMTASSAGTESAAPALTTEEAARILSAAIALWESSGASVEAADGIELVVVDLPETLLAVTDGATIYIDITAANHGWFVDETPLDNREYRAGKDGLVARPNTDAYANIDLLTVLAHEVGHVLGYEHTDDGLMSAELAPGVRQLEIDSVALFLDLPLGESALPGKRARWTSLFE